MNWLGLIGWILFILTAAALVGVLGGASAKIKGQKDSMEIKDSYIHRLEEQVKGHSRAVYNKQCCVDRQKKKIKELEKDNERLSKIRA